MCDLRLTQKIEHAHKGAIYCIEFSKKGDYLATGGQDSKELLERCSIQ